MLIPSSLIIEILHPKTKITKIYKKETVTPYIACKSEPEIDTQHTGLVPTDTKDYYIYTQYSKKDLVSKMNSYHKYADPVYTIHTVTFKEEDNIKVYAPIFNSCINLNNRQWDSIKYKKALIAYLNTKCIPSCLPIKGLRQMGK